MEDPRRNALHSASAIEAEIATVDRECVASVERIQAETLRRIAEVYQRADVVRRQLFLRLARVGIAARVLEDLDEGQQDRVPTSDEGATAGKGAAEPRPKPASMSKTPQASSPKSPKGALASSTSSKTLILRTLLDSGGLLATQDLKQAIIDQGVKSGALKRMRTRMKQEGLLEEEGEMSTLTEKGRHAAANLSDLLVGRHRDGDALTRDHVPDTCVE